MRIGTRVVAGVVVAMLACSAAQARAEGTYVALGDSLAAGIGASTSSKGYVGLVRSALASHAGVTAASFHGQPGATSLSLRTGGQLAAAIAAIDNAFDTTHVTIDIGGNDVLGGLCVGNWDTPACGFRTNFAQTLDDLLAALTADPGAETLVTMAYYNPASGLGNGTETNFDTQLLGANGILDAADTGADVGINDVILQESQSRALPVANPYPAFEAAGQAFISGDGIHPNDAGYAAIAQAFCDVIVISCTVTPPGDPPKSDPPVSDTTPPETSIDRSPPRRSERRRVRIAFSSDEAPAAFECRLDDRPFAACSSPVRLRVRPGRHRFQVRATDAAGNVDRSPASVRFRVKRKR